jgi:uncharacterized membrane protein
VYTSDHQGDLPPPEFSAAELSALAHLYRGEMYRSKIWRTRLDATTNWAVAVTGIALSITFSDANNSPVPLILAGLMALVFLLIEARRYRYFDIWRTRTRLFEVYFWTPLLLRQPLLGTTDWNKALAQDLFYVHFHISLWEAVGRRLRRNYSWIFLILAVSYLGKILIHPTPLARLDHLWERAAQGPIPGQVVVAVGLLFYAGLVVVALGTLRQQKAAGRAHADSGRGDRQDPIMRMFT